METSKNKQTTSHQFEILVDFMRLHPDLSKGHLKTANAKNAANNSWKNLECDLNAAGPPMRDVVGWKKVWADYKNHLKAKMRRNKASISGTGGGPSTHIPITPLEEEVSQLLSMEEAVNGVSGTLQFGVEQTTTAEILAEPEQETTFTPLRSRVRIAPRSKESLLEKQVNNQMEYHKNSLKILKDINENLKGVSKYSKRIYELKEKKFKLAKENLEHKKLKHIENTKLKIAKLEIKKQMVELEREKY